MDKNRIDNSEKGRMLAEEIVRIMREKELKTSLDDYPLLKEALDKNEYHDELMNKICDEEYLTNAVASFHNKNRDESASQFGERLEFKARTKRRSRIFLKYTAACAAAFAVLSLLVYNVMNKNVNEVSLALNQDKKTEIKVPTLVYGNDVVVDLLNKDIDKVIAGLEDKTLKEEGTKEVQYNTVIIPDKFTYTVTLSDSTVVTLNANSQIRYPRSFDGAERKIYLKGEAFFKVQKGDKPFIVSTNEGEIKVYGTKFNVNLNRNNTIQVLLVNGSVGVRLAENGSKNEEIMLKPKEVLEYNSYSGARSLLKDVNVEDYISWMDGGFKYSGIELSNLLQELSAWYGVAFEYRCKIGNMPISINLNRDIELDKLLKILETMTGVKFIKEKGGLYSVN